MAGLPVRPALCRSPAPDAFCWATGIEDTFIRDPWPGTGRTLDEYELTGHYDRWRDDIDRIASLGVTAARYGIPWHRVQPAPDRFDFAFADETLGRLLEHGVEPIVDLVHYGTPLWLEGSFLHPDFPARMAEYAAAIGERFAGRVRCYTPLNEPRIAAWYCGRLGWWPPYRRSWSGFVAVLLACCRGMAQAERALRQIDPEIVIVPADATDLYESDDPALAGEVTFRQELVFLALDLLTGRVGPDHPLRGWLIAHGAEPAVLEELAGDPITLDLVGINLYPMFTRKRVQRTRGRLQMRSVPAGPDLLERIGELYAARYRRPVLVTETAAAGSVRRRRAWLEGSVAAIARLRARGVPLIGYTWWPLFSLVGWSYRQGDRSLAQSLISMGLWDLDPVDLSRIPTSLVEDYRKLVAAGSGAVGRLATAELAGD